MIKEIIKDEVAKHFSELIEIRRYLHKNPELSFQEKNTAKFIENYLRELGIEDIRTNVGLNGIVATIKGKLNGPTLALRADFDSLPIDDLKETSYKSQVPHVMHACGHDGHTATLLVTCKILMKHLDKINGTIVAIFQYGEEQAPGGAKPMIDAGALNGVQAIFGAHLWTPLSLGTLGYSNKELCAAADRFEIKIQSKSNANVIATELISLAQQIVSRFTKPRETIVLTFGAMDCTKENGNIVGTLRTFNKNVQKLALDKIQALCESLEKLHNSHIQFIYHGGYPAVINNEIANNELLKVTREILPEEKLSEIEPLMIGEDFAYYLENVPGAFFLIGAGNDSYAKYPHHHPNFDFEEEVMAHTTAIFLNLAFNSKSIVAKLKEEI